MPKKKQKYNFNFYKKLLAKKLESSGWHNHLTLTFNYDLLVNMVGDLGSLMLYVMLRRYARWTHGNFEKIIPALTDHQRKVLLKRLEGLGLIKDNCIVNHSELSTEQYGNKFCKLPSSVDSKPKLKAFIIGLIETRKLQIRIGSYKKHDNAIVRDQNKGDKVKTCLRSRHRMQYIGYVGRVSRNAIAKIAGCCDATVSRARKLSQNKYRRNAPEFVEWMSDEGTYDPKFRMFVKYHSSTVISKSILYFNSKFYKSSLRLQPAGLL